MRFLISWGLGFQGHDSVTEPQVLTNERLKQLLSDADPILQSTSADAAKQKLKIAFAEGYMAGNGNPNSQNPSKAAKYLRIVQQVLTIIIFVGIVASLMASAGGSVFR